MQDIFISKKYENRDMIAIEDENIINPVELSRYVKSSLKRLSYDDLPDPPKVKWDDFIEDGINVLKKYDNNLNLGLYGHTIKEQLNAFRSNFLNIINRVSYMIDSIGQWRTIDIEYCIKNYLLLSNISMSRSIWGYIDLLFQKSTEIQKKFKSNFDTLDVRNEDKFFNFSRVFNSENVYAARIDGIGHMSLINNRDVYGAPVYIFGNLGFLSKLKQHAYDPHVKLDSWIKESFKFIFVPQFEYFIATGGGPSATGMPLSIKIEYELPVVIRIIRDKYWKEINLSKIGISAHHS